VSSDRNKHVSDYLSYYLELPYSPNYAVLVSGPWGVGKTHLIKNFLQRKFDLKERKYVYISLYGLSSLEEIDEALLEAIYPALGWRATKVAARVGKSLLKRVGVEADVKITDLVNRFDPNVFIFDDLERYEAPISKALGYINQFVEHDGCKVIIVANEAEIPGGDDYHRRREKLIGKALEVQSAFEDAFGFFLSRIKSSKIRSLFEASAAEIAAIYAQSGLNNLRVLQQTMWDFERFCEALTESHRANLEAMTALLRLMFAFSFELKAGRLKAEDLRLRVNSLTIAMSKKLEKEKSRQALAQERYPEIDLSDFMISNNVLVDVLIKGIVDSEAINSSLGESRYFITAKEPAWRTVWHWFERTDAEFKKAAAQMERQFSEHEFIVTGELLHVLGLRFFLSDLQILKLSRAEVTEQGKRYIDALYERNVLASDIDAFSEIRFGGYGGLGICENETDEYRELFAYLQNKGRQALEESYPSKGIALLYEMKVDPTLFFRRVCLTNNDDNIYYRVPILASINPDTFVVSFLDLHPAHQRTVMMALRSRYEHSALERELASEKDWLHSIISKLKERATGMSEIGRYRLLKNIESNLASFLPVQ
jgi:hypothetical protein